jgi:hypothetical protein
VRCGRGALSSRRPTRTPRRLPPRCVRALPVSIRCAAAIGVQLLSRPRSRLVRRLRCLWGVYGVSSTAALAPAGGWEAWPNGAREDALRRPCAQGPHVAAQAFVHACACTCTPIGDRADRGLARRTYVRFALIRARCRRGHATWRAHGHVALIPSRTPRLFRRARHNSPPWRCHRVYPAPRVHLPACCPVSSVAAAAAAAPSCLFLFWVCVCASAFADAGRNRRR